MRNPPRTDLETLFDASWAWVAHTYPGLALEQITLRLAGGKKVKLPAPLPTFAGPVAASDLPFVPSAFQQGILDALEDKAMRTDALGAAVGDRSRLFKPGGIKELREQGLVAHHDRLGYYRPDAPPEALQDLE